MQPSFVPPQSSNLIFGTLARALSAMWEMFWPLLLPLGVFLAFIFLAYVARKFTNVG